MLEPDDQVWAYWAQHGSIRQDPEGLETMLGVPHHELTPLVRYGLPIEVDDLFVAEQAHRVSIGPDSDYLVALGRAWHGACTVGLNAEDLTVWSAVEVDDGGYEVTFMNSDITNFASFLFHVHIMAKRVQEVSRAVFLESAHRIRQELTEYDPRAMQEGAWWSSILEEMTELV